MKSFVEEATDKIRAPVGDGRVVCGLSGGVDSTVAAMIIHRAIGDNLTCIFVDNGVLRQDEANQIRKRFERLKLPLIFADASQLFLDRLAGVTDPDVARWADAPATDSSTTYRRAAAVTAARMYYGAGLSTQEIADHLKVSRSTVSRLLAYARESGVVEVRLHETTDHVSSLTADLLARYPRVRFQVIGVHPAATGGRIKAAVAALVSVPAAAAVFTGLFAVGGTADVPVDTVLTAMLGWHTVIGLGEAAITALVVGAVVASRPDLVYGARGLASTRTPSTAGVSA